MTYRTRSVRSTVLRGPAPAGRTTATRRDSPIGPKLGRNTALLSTALTAGIFAVSTLWPSDEAFAQCAPDPGLNVVCPAGVDANGYSDATDATASVEVQSGASLGDSINVTGSSKNLVVTMDGVSSITGVTKSGAINLDTTGSVSITTQPGTTILGSGPGNTDGIRVRAGGNVDLILNSGIQASSGAGANNAQGLDISSTGGNVNIDIQTGYVYAKGLDNNQQAVVASTSGSGNIDISVGSQGVAEVESYGTGIWAFNKDAGGSGNIAVNVGEDGSVESTNQNAIQVEIAGTGTVNVVNKGEVTAELDGINVISTNIAGGGLITVENYGNTIIAGKDGVDITAAGPTDVKVIQAGVIDAGFDGIFVSTQGGDITVDGKDGEYGSIVAANYGMNLSTNATGTIEVDAGDINSTLDGVRARSVDGDIDITLHGTVNSKTDDGVDAETSGSGNVTVNLTATTVVTAGNGAGDAGIQAGATGDGNVSVLDNGTIGATITSTDVGIDAYTFGTGDIDVDVQGTSVTAANTGILGRAFSDGNIDLVSGEVTAGKNGVLGVATGSGNVNATNEGVVTITGVGLVGVGALALGGGDATVNVNDEIQIDGFVFAAAGAVAKDGNATVNVNAPINVDGIAIFGAAAAAGGAANEALVNVDEKITEGPAGKIFVGAAAIGFGGADATVNVNADIDPPLVGALAFTIGAGDATVNVADGVLVEADILGVGAGNIGTGDVEVLMEGTINAGFVGIGTLQIGPGDTTITVDGDIEGLAGAKTGFAGVLAGRFGGDGLVDIDISADSTIRSDGVGVAVLQFKSLGDITIQHDGSIESDGAGIGVLSIFSKGDIDIALGAGASVVSDNDDGIAVFAPFHLGDTTIVTDVDSQVIAETGAAVRVVTFSKFGDNTVVLDNSGLLVGLGDDLGNATVEIASDGPIEIVNRFDGFITNVAGLDADVAIRASTTHVDGVLIDNDGIIQGRVFTSDEDDTFLNTGEWWVEGDNFFGLGNDVLDNKGGIIFANTQTFLSTTLLDGLEDLFNDGGIITQQDGVDPFNVLTTTGNYHGGPASGQYWIDATLDFVAGDGEGDLFEIGGDATGVTYVNVFNTDPDGVGGYDPEGILIVGVNGVSDGVGTFRLDNGPIDVGFFSYDIYYEPVGVSGYAEEFWLRSDVNGRAYELPALTSAVQELFHSSNQTWLDRTADLRIFTNPGVGTMDAAVNRAESGYTDGSPGFWLRGWGSWLERDRTVRVNTGLGEVNHDGGYDQDSWGVQAGIDFPLTQPNDPNGTFIIGALVGYADSRVRFDSTDSRADIDGFQVGIYGTYLLGGFFADLLVKAEFLDLDYDTRFGPGIVNSSDSTSVTNFGAVFDTGYRFDFDGFFFEPQGTLAYVHSDMGNLDLLQTDVSLSNGDSFRGRLGARAGARIMPTSATVIEPWIGLSVWHEFSGSNDARLSTAGGTVSVSDSIRDTWGVASAGVNIVDFGSGMSGFVKGDYRFGGDTEGFSGQAGFRVNF